METISIPEDKPSSPKGRITVLIVGLVLLAVLGGWYWIYRTSPRYSMLQAFDAVHEHDFDRFEKYVDIDSVLGGVLDAAMPNTQDNPFATGLAVLMKPTMIAALTSQMRSTIEKGDVKEVEQKSRSSAVTSLWETGNARKPFTLETIGTEGKLAFVRLTLKGEEMKFDFKLRQRDGYWQIIEWTNMKQLLDSQKAASPPRKPKN